MKYIIYLQIKIARKYKYCMPQLDFSFYFSQISWLLVTFFSFFFVSKFLILPRLERILSNRQSIINNNLEFAKEKIEEAKKINTYCDEKINKAKELAENEISKTLANLQERNSKKINDLKKRLLDAENKDILDVKKEFKNIEDELNASIIEIVAEIIKKIYCVDADKEKIKVIFNNL